MTIKQLFSTRQIAKPLLMTLFVLLSACTPSNEKTASLSSTSGFGGTGYKPSGFGGTGIVGTITDFGSIWVNGVEVDYGENVKITSNLLAKDSLKLGQQVVLETQSGTAKTETKKIHIYYPIAGKITAINQENITLNYRYTVKVDQALMDKDLSLKKGEFVAINGFSDSAKSWVATRINRNLQHKIFYQPQPKLQFSASVKQVLIETTSEQLKQWDNIRVNVKQLPQTHTRFMFSGKIKNNHIHLDRASPVSSHSKKQGKEAQKQGNTYGTKVRSNQSQAGFSGWQGRSVTTDGKNGHSESQHGDGGDSNGGMGGGFGGGGHGGRR